MIYALALLLLLAISLVGMLSFYTLHKVRRIHLMMHGVSDQAINGPANLFRQLEALQGLYIELGLKKSLPTTRGWAVSPDFLMELMRHALREKPLVVVECSSGTSTLVLARCMQINGAGKVYSLEHDVHFAEQTRLQLRRHGLSEWAEVLAAPLGERQFGADSWPWYGLEELPDGAPIGMLVIDGPPMGTGVLARYPAGPALFHRMGDGASIFLDDATRADEKAILLRWAAEFPLYEQSSRQCEKGCAVLTRAR